MNIYECYVCLGWKQLAVPKLTVMVTAETNVKEVILKIVLKVISNVFPKPAFSIHISSGNLYEATWYCTQNIHRKPF